MCPAHVVPVPLGADPPLGQPRIRRLPAGRAVGAADRSVLVHEAAQGPARARVLGCWPGDNRKTSVLMMDMGHTTHLGTAAPRGSGDTSVTCPAGHLDWSRKLLFYAHQQNQ